MALLGQEYESSDGGGSPITTRGGNATPVVAAPEVSLDVWSYNFLFQGARTNVLQDPMRLQMMLAQPTDTTLTYNVPYADLSRPEQGPAHPFKNADGNALKRKNVLTGRAEEIYISDSTFAANHNSYQSVKGYARNPNGVGADIGYGNSAQGYGNLDLVPSKERSKELRAKRQKVGDPSIVEGEGRYLGPWRRYRDEDRVYEDEAAVAGEELASDEEYIEDAIEPVPTTAAPLATDYQEDISNAPTTEWHGSEERLRDYQGRSFMYTPRKESEVLKNYIPKKLIHTYKYHTKAINALRFFPKSGHLLLAASADTKISLSDTGFDRELLRTYSGHGKSVSDIDFSPDGISFLSSGYDRKILLWDTETGKTMQNFGNGKIPHVIKFNPSQPHEFLAGMSDNTILQFDCRSGETINTYDHHLGNPSLNLHLLKVPTNPHIHRRHQHPNLHRPRPPLLLHRRRPRRHGLGIRHWRPH